MEFTLKQQIFNFFIFFLFGIILAIFLDFLKIIEFILHEKAKHSSHNIRDILFFTISSLFSYLLTLALNNGELAFYIFFAEFLGYLLWRKTLSCRMVKFSENAIKAIKKPVKGAYKKIILKINKLTTLCKNKLNKILNQTQNIFLKYFKWKVFFKIKKKSN